jgi:hypothetical protein
MNLSSKLLNSRDAECTAIKINNASNVLHLLQKTLKKLSEVSDLPIKIICDEKNKYLIRQQLNEMSCGTEVFLNGDISHPEPSVLFTVTLQ